MHILISWVLSKVRSCKPGCATRFLCSTARIRRYISAASFCRYQLLWRSNHWVLLPCFNTQSDIFACRRICLLCQQTSPKRWMGNVKMASDCEVTKSAYQVQMTTICHWMKPAHENFLRTHWPLCSTDMIKKHWGQPTPKMENLITTVC